MHYFKIHIGDYAKKTGHLSPLEHGIYLLIIHAYYDREQAPTLLEATRWARARTEEEKNAVLGILDEFFELGADGLYRQTRIEEELTSYHEKAEINRGIALDREKKRREAREAKHSVHESCTDREPTVHHKEHESSTTSEPNHKPLTNNQNTNTPIPPEGAKSEGKKKERAAFALATYLKECKEAGLMPIPDGDPVFAYADEAGISHEFLALHWSEFRTRYTMEGAKKYKAWKTVFNKSVRGNWFDIWRFDNNGTCVLTTVGMQAKNLAEAAARKSA